MGIYTESVQKLYVAYFNRPADPAGLAYWETVVANNAGNTAPISAAFSQSPEYVAAFAGMNNNAVVNTIYQNLFGRSAEAEGLLFWAQALNEGRMTVSDAVTNIADGALTTDLTAVNNKVIAATAFTAALDTTAEILAYDGATANAAAKAWLSAVTDDASLATQQASLDATLAAIVTATPDANAGQTFTLTTGSDVITTTQASLNNGVIQLTTKAGSGNDTFLAEANGLFTAGDVLDGGTGTDTLLARYSQEAAGAISVGRLTSVERVFVRADLDTATAGTETSTIDTTEWTGVEQLWADRVTSVGANDTLQFDNVSKATTLGLKGGVEATAANVTFALKAADIVGSTDAATLAVSEARYGIVTIDGIEDLTVATSTAASTIKTLTTAAATKLTVTGDQNLTITDALGTTVKTVNASAATGKVNVTLGTVTGTVSAMGGSGDDTIGLGALVATASTTINGGTGNNTLKVNAASAAITAQLVNLTNTNVTNIKTLDFGGNIVALNLNDVKFTVSDFVFSDTASAQAIAITNHSSANTYTLTGGAGTGTDETSFTIATLKETNTLSNVLNLTLVNSDVGAIDGSTASYTIETMNLVSNKSSTGVLEDDANTLGTVTVNAGGSVNLSGNANTTLTLGAAATLTASSLTGKLTAIGSAGADTIVGTAQADTITGGAGIDTITLGGGIDTFKVSVAAADGADRNIIKDFVAGSSGDVFNLNSSVGSLDGSNGFTSSAALQAHTAGGNITLNGAAEVVVISSATIANITDANSLNGTNLLSAVAGTITGAAAADAATNEYLFAIGIQGGGTAIYFGNAGTGNNTFEAGEITLVGVLENVTLSSLTFNNFANAAA